MHIRIKHHINEHFECNFCCCWKSSNVNAQNNSTQNQISHHFMRALQFFMNEILLIWINSIRIVIPNNANKSLQTQNFTYFLCHYSIISNYFDPHHHNRCHHQNYFELLSINTKTFHESIPSTDLFSFEIIFCYCCHMKKKIESISLLF